MAEPLDERDGYCVVQTNTQQVDLDLGVMCNGELVHGQRRLLENLLRFSKEASPAVIRRDKALLEAVCRYMNAGASMLDLRFVVDAFLDAACRMPEIDRNALRLLDYREEVESQYAFLDKTTGKVTVVVPGVYVERITLEEYNNGLNEHNDPSFIQPQTGIQPKEADRE